MEGSAIDEIIIPTFWRIGVDSGDCLAGVFQREIQAKQEKMTS